MAIFFGGKLQENMKRMVISYASKGKTILNKLSLQKESYKQYKYKSHGEFDLASEWMLVACLALAIEWELVLLVANE